MIIIYFIIKNNNYCEWNYEHKDFYKIQKEIEDRSWCH